MNTKQLDKFYQYCKEHPELRFYQALVNFSGYKFIGHAQSYDGKKFKDLWEERDIKK